ncbi:MAG: hypothetical protein QM534_18080 [Sediminibacterium sp.]|nr:hypothetical protein [Sediminibacterium sp.]
MKHLLVRYLTPLVMLFALQASAQTFEIDQIEQLFRPRLKFDSKYLFDSPFSDTSGRFQAQELNTVLTFPIKSKLNAEVKLDLSSLKLKDIFQNSVRVRASQVLGVFRANVKQVKVGFDSLPTKNIVTAAGGIMGTWLTRKYRVAFYNVNVAIAEQDKTLPYTVPRFSGLIGQLHLRGVRRNFFYGIGATYSDGLLLPAPFFGGSEPIGRNFIFNYTLPVQINLQYKDSRKTLVTMGVSADGYRTGINYNRKRVNVNYTAALAFANIRYRFTKNLAGRLEAGYVFYQSWNYAKMDSIQTRFSPGPGPYVQVGFNVLFGPTLWEKIIDKIIQS